MQLHDQPFAAIDWNAVAPAEHPGETGTATWRTVQMGDIRIRRVDYSAGYRADHWCDKGHILYCLEGELRTELKDGRIVVMTPGCSYLVADGAQPHRSSTAAGAKLFIVD
jgi:hypothetical protein